MERPDSRFTSKQVDHCPDRFNNASDFCVQIAKNTLSLAGQFFYTGEDPAMFVNCILYLFHYSCLRFLIKKFGPFGIIIFVFT